MQVHENHNQGDHPAAGHHHAGPRLLASGEVAFAAMLEAIRAAQKSVCLEMYIIHASAIAEKFREALTAAARRGAAVRVLGDAFGSMELPAAFWAPLIEAGGEFRRFNPLTRHWFGLRDHRKVLVCDGTMAFIGGVNLAAEYDGDGVKSGWRDFGLQLDGGLAPELARAFDEMWQQADFGGRRRFVWLRKAVRRRAVVKNHETLLLSAPGWHHSALMRQLLVDFKAAKRIQIISAYFLPTYRLLRALKRAARRGAQVQLLLPAKSDLPLMQLATRGLYRRLLKAGVEIYEYQPQILHAKLVLVDTAIVYAGSANLDVRSLHLNYELLVRLQNQRLAQEVGAMYAADLNHCRKWELQEWMKGRTWWRRLKSRLAHLLLAWLDPYLARRQVKQMRKE